jgi:cyclophilin family peptidyl-prolyl cis-trans isomerase
MKITLENGITVDTDKMTDKEAAISEAISHLYQTCRQYGVTSFARVIIDKKKYMGMSSTTNNSKQTLCDYEFLVETMALFLRETSNGTIAVAIAQPPDDQASSE